MHILFLTDNFPPEVNAPASRTFEHCREWAKAGHRVTIITCAPNFPKGRLYEGYKNKFWQSEHIEGIRVIRVWTYIAANEGFINRIFDYLSFMVTATFSGMFVRGIDIVIGTSPQLFTACAAWMISVFKRVRFIFELRDLWPESIKAVGAMRESALIRVLEKIEMFLYRRANRIVSVTHAFKDILVRRGIDHSKITVITNGVDLSRFRPQPKDAQLLHRLGFRNKFICGYIGTHGMAHHLETILDAVEIIRTEPNCKYFHFLLLGNGARKAAIQKDAMRRGLDNITFVDTVPKDEVVRYWSLLDVAIIHLKKTKLFTTVIPSKLFECMAMGLPVLHGVEGESAEIVRREKIGIVFEPENASDLARHLKHLSLDRNAYDVYKNNCLIAAKKYERTALAMKMLDVITAND